jgi:hypothetical protein
MPSKPPKCKLCGVEHWNSEPHVFARETAPAPKPRPVNVTQPVTESVTQPVTESVTQPVTESVTQPVTPVTQPVTPVTRPVTTTPSVTQPVTPVTKSVTQGEECVCPTCGSSHTPGGRMYNSPAEKQRAYRARRSGNGQSD